MALDNVKSEIMDRVKKEADEIKKSAKEDITRIQELAKKQLEDYRNGLKQEEDKVVQDYQKHKESMEQFSLRKHEFRIYSEQLDMTRKAVAAKLSKLDGKTRQEHVKKLIAAAEKELDIARVYCNKADAGYIKNYDVVTKDDMTGGIIVENKEGDIRIDYSYDAYANRIFDENIAKIRSILLEQND